MKSFVLEQYRRTIAASYETLSTYSVCYACNVRQSDGDLENSRAGKDLPSALLVDSSDPGSLRSESVRTFALVRVA